MHTHTYIYTYIYTHKHIHMHTHTHAGQTKRSKISSHSLDTKTHTSICTSMSIREVYVYHRHVFKQVKKTTHVC